MEVGKKHFVDIENHVCCEYCQEVYLRTVECPICKCNDIVVDDFEEKECECDCGATFYLERSNEDYKAILTEK